VARPDTMRQPYPYEEDQRYPEDNHQSGGFNYQSNFTDEEGAYFRDAGASKKSNIDLWMEQEVSFLPGIKRKSVAMFFMRLPAFIPWIFVMRGWLSLNEKNSLTTGEAEILGTGGEFCFLMAITITPAITLTGVRFFAPLRRWYGIFFALIGISDGTTAAITTDFAGGPMGRLAGHSFLLSGLLIMLVAFPLLLTANTPMQRVMGRYWKRLQRFTYLLWVMIALHLLLLDGFTPFGGDAGDGVPIFHSRFYQFLVISIPLLVLRLPPVKRWVIETRNEGRQWLVWVAFAPMLALFFLGLAFVINEEVFIGTLNLTMHPQTD
jgi:DMSO/TMAO reductase YedYZ heme-binding membrane subunit